MAGFGTFGASSFAARRNQPMSVGGGFGQQTNQPTPQPDQTQQNTTDQQDQYQKSVRRLQQQAQGVQTAAQRAAKAADFFSPERGRYTQGLRQLMRTGSSKIGADPSYQFRLQEGKGALESTLASQGLLGSGRAALDIQKYGQQAASDEYQAQYKRLFDLSGVSKSDPSMAADLRFRGAQAPLDVMKQTTGFKFSQLEADRSRAFKQSEAAIKHQQDLERLKLGSSLTKRPDTGFGTRGSFGGGGAGGGSSQPSQLAGGKSLNMGAGNTPQEYVPDPKDTYQEQYRKRAEWQARQTMDTPTTPKYNRQLDEFKRQNPDRYGPQPPRTLRNI